MEEVGPEAHELFEKTEEYSHHSAHEHEESDESEETRGSSSTNNSRNGKNQHASIHTKSTFTTRCAVTASILAVFAAISSLLSGHYANEAVLKQTEASDRWAQYQATSTKSHIGEANLQVLQALDGNVNKDVQARLGASIGNIEGNIKKYQAEKDEIKRNAEALESMSHKSLTEHENFSLGVACFQIGIVLASVAILVHDRKLFFSSIGAGLVGLICLALGFLS